MVYDEYTGLQALTKEKMTTEENHAMKYMHSEWRQRLNHWLETLKQDLYLPLGNIDVEAFLTMDWQQFPVR